MSKWHKALTKRGQAHPICLTILVALLLTSTGMAPGSPPASAFLLYNRDQLDSIKVLLKQGQADDLQPALKSLIKHAGEAAKLVPPSVVEKKTAPSGADLHDYVSLAIYYWPDPSKPDGKPYIPRDGKANPERESPGLYDEARMGQMVGAVTNLSLAYYLNGDEEYAARATAFLRTWFLDPATRMKPSLSFSQGVPGKSYGRPTGIIETVQLISLTDAICMLETSQSWTHEDDTGMKNWFSNYLDWLLTSQFGVEEGNALNNHGVWYDAQVASFAWFVGRDDLAARTVKEAMKRRIQAQIEPDGSMPRELARTRSMHYTMYNLEAFITLARVGDRVGVNLWDHRTGDGRSLRVAIDFLVPYLTGAKTWRYQNIIPEHDAGFARYLAMAERHYRTRAYLEAIRKTLADEQARERIAAETFMR